MFKGCFTQMEHVSLVKLLTVRLFVTLKTVSDGMSWFRLWWPIHVSGLIYRKTSV